MLEKKWIVFKNTEDKPKRAFSWENQWESQWIEKERPKTIEDRFLTWDAISKDYSWVISMDKAHMFTEKKARIMASMYLGVADLHPKYRYD